MCAFIKAFVAVVVIFTAPACLAAEKNQDYRLFEKIFLQWTEAFNHKDLNASCNLFSKKMQADYQGAPTKNYTSVCDGFQKVFAQNREYKYSFTLHHVYRSDDLAAVRITWYLRVTKKGKLLSENQDEGIDIFQKDHGRWKIINYIAYPLQRSRE